MSTTLNLTPKGLAFTRLFRALVIAHGDWAEARAYAEGQRWTNTPTVVTGLRSAVDAIDPTDAAAMLQPVAWDFAEYIRPLTILGRLQGMRRVAFDVPMLNQTGGATASWAEEAEPTPISAASFGETQVLKRAKVTSAIVVPEELARSSNPAAELALRDDLGRAAAQAIDIAFIDPTNAGATEKPASLTYGATTSVSTGATLANVDADLGAMVDSLTDLAVAHWIVHPRTATSLSRLRGTGGALAYPTVNARGGTLMGLPVIVSANVPMAGSPAETSIVLLDADGVALADDSQAEFEVARHASIVMDDAPNTGAQQLVSLWQANMAALRVRRWLNWQARRAGIAAVLTGVTF
ncbi:MAG: phage major capsid protein [Burkholderiaceae bacterium]|jgi:hypothetical protein|nr:phage major capsid protein [Burkholderiaceae bacterium]